MCDVRVCVCALTISHSSYEMSMMTNVAHVYMFKLLLAQMYVVALVFSLFRMIFTAAVRLWTHIEYVQSGIS